MGRRSVASATLITLFSTFNKTLRHTAAISCAFFTIFDNDDDDFDDV